MDHPTVGRKRKEPPTATAAPPNPGMEESLSAHFGRLTNEDAPLATDTIIDGGGGGGGEGVRLQQLTNITRPLKQRPSSTRQFSQRSSSWSLSNLQEGAALQRAMIMQHGSISVSPSSTDGDSSVTFDAFTPEQWQAIECLSREELLVKLRGFHKSAIKLQLERDDLLEKNGLLAKERDHLRDENARLAEETRSFRGGELKPTPLDDDGDDDGDSTVAFARTVRGADFMDRVFARYAAREKAAANTQKKRGNFARR